MQNSIPGPVFENDTLGEGHRNWDLMRGPWSLDKGVFLMPKKRNAKQHPWAQKSTTEDGRGCPREDEDAGAGHHVEMTTTTTTRLGERATKQNKARLGRDWTEAALSRAAPKKEVAQDSAAGEARDKGE